LLGGGSWQTVGRSSCSSRPAAQLSRRSATVPAALVDAPELEVRVGGVGRELNGSDGGRVGVVEEFWALLQRTGKRELVRA
jgi:hypothetical protein